MSKFKLQCSGWYSVQTSVQWVVFSADFSAVDGIQCRLQCSGWYSVQTSVQWMVFSADFSAVGGIKCRLQCSGWYSVQTSVQWVVFIVVNQFWSKGGSRSMKKRDFESKRGSFQEIGAKWSKFSQNSTF